MMDNRANAFRGSDIISLDPEDVSNDSSCWTQTNSASIATKSPFPGKLSALPKPGVSEEKRGVSWFVYSSIWKGNKYLPDTVNFGPPPLDMDFVSIALTFTMVSRRRSASLSSLLGSTSTTSFAPLQGSLISRNKTMDLTETFHFSEENNTQFWNWIRKDLRFLEFCVEWANIIRIVKFWYNESVD